MQLTFMLMAAAVLVPGPEKKDTAAELVSTTKIWDGASRNTQADIIRFKDRWYVVCVESSEERGRDAALRIIASEDAVKWESVDLLKSPTPNRGLNSPSFTLMPDGQLMISAYGIIARPDLPQPIPQFGGTINTMGWFSKDGKKWSESNQIGVMDYIFCKILWNDGTAYSFASGCICGIMQTVQLYSSKTGKNFNSVYEQTFSGFFPEEADIVFDGDEVYCLMSRGGGAIAEEGRQKGYFGKSKAPYRQWEWQETDQRLTRPNLMRLADGRILASIGIIDKKTRTAICELDPKTGKLKELLELPTEGRTTEVGLAMHDGHLWVSYHKLHSGKWSVHLAKVKLTRK